MISQVFRWTKQRCISSCSIRTAPTSCPPFADRALQASWYRLSAQIYARLLQRAQAHLPAADRSLLTILDKLAQIMAESGQGAERTVQLCRQQVAAAEKALELQEDIKRERKLIKIKNRLMKIEAGMAEGAA